jgi:hypothetical protein
LVDLRRPAGPRPPGRAVADRVVHPLWHKAGGRECCRPCNMGLTQPRACSQCTWQPAMPISKDLRSAPKRATMQACNRPGTRTATLRTEHSTSYGNGLPCPWQASSHGHNNRAQLGTARHSTIRQACTN